MTEILTRCIEFFKYIYKKHVTRELKSIPLQSGLERVVDITVFEYTGISNNPLFSIPT